MPIHDWTRVSPGTFHDFHSSWITHLKESLNDGLLPDGYYALAEQHFKQMIADVLTLHVESSDQTSPITSRDRGPVAVAQAPPRVRWKMVAEPYETLRKSIAIRRSSTHRVVALIEIVSPGNKARGTAVDEFVKKVWSALNLGVHVLVVDLFPPGKFDPNGIHAEIWKGFDSDPYLLPGGLQSTFASYMADMSIDAYIEHAIVGDSLPEMPLFLDPGWYINCPLESTYESAWRGVPKVWKDAIESGIR